MTDRSHRLDDEEDEDEVETTESEANNRDPMFMERQLMNARTIMLTGPVTDKMHRECASRLFVLEQLDAKAAVNVFINSPGGSADSGFAIYDLLRFVDMPINTIVNGLSASAGILLQLAAPKERRFCMAESRFMIHQPSTMGRGTASDLDITAREVIKLRERYIKIIASAAGVDGERVMKDAQRDFWLNAKEALEYGLVGKIVESRSELPKE